MIPFSTMLEAYLCAQLDHRAPVWCEVKGSQGYPREMRSLLLEAAALASQPEAGSSGARQGGRCSVRGQLAAGEAADA